MSFSWMAVLFGGLGVLLGLLTPAGIQKLLALKCKQYDMEMPESKCLTNRMCRTIFSLLLGFLFFVFLSLTPHVIIGLWLCFLVYMGVIITWVDVKIRLIPDEVLVCGAVICLVFYFILGLEKAIFSNFLGLGFVLLLLGVIAFLTKAEAVGWGDVKLGALIGFFTGFPGALLALLGMSVAVVLVALPGILLGRLKLKSSLPYGGFFMVGWIAVFIMGNYLLPS